MPAAKLQSCAVLGLSLSQQRQQGQNGFGLQRTFPVLGVSRTGRQGVVLRAMRLTLQSFCRCCRIKRSDDSEGHRNLTRHWSTSCSSTRYDSTLDFDDAIPDEAINASLFTSSCQTSKERSTRAVFLRHLDRSSDETRAGAQGCGRVAPGLWVISEWWRFPVPELGDDQTDMVKVRKATCVTLSLFKEQI